MLASQHAQLQYACQHANCNRWFKNPSGLTQHEHAIHPRVPISPSPPQSRPAPLNPLPPRSPTPPQAADADIPSLDAEYLGPRDAVFWNYHPFMTGKFVGALELLLYI